MLAPDILYEDNSIIALNKPPQTYSVNKAKGNQNSLANWLSVNRPECLKASNGRDCGLCHRLDKDTSGVIIAAKNSSSYSSLREQFSSNKIIKEYSLFVEGECKKAGLLTSYLYGRYKRSKKVSVTDEQYADKYKAKLCKLTINKSLYLSEDDITSLKITLITGFRHQIRAQLSTIGHPLIGDSLYGAKRALSSLSEIAFTGRTAKERAFYLHASKIAFQHPEKNKKLEIIAKKH